MAELLAAIFSMITTIWLIITVWIQRRELVLQREELALQRQDSHRIAEETGRQAILMREQLRLAFKVRAEFEVKAYINLDIPRIRAIMNAFKAKVEAIISKRQKSKVTVNHFRRLYGHDELRVVMNNSGKILRLNYERLIEKWTDDYPLKVLSRWHLEAKTHDLSEWFRLDLPFLVGDIRDEKGQIKLSATEVRLLMNVAARIS